MFVRLGPTSDILLDSKLLLEGTTPRGLHEQTPRSQRRDELGVAPSAISPNLLEWQDFLPLPNKLISILQNLPGPRAVPIAEESFILQRIFEVRGMLLTKERSDFMGFAAAPKAVAAGLAPSPFVLPGEAPSVLKFSFWLGFFMLDPASATVSGSLRSFLFPCPPQNGGFVVGAEWNPGPSGGEAFRADLDSVAKIFGDFGSSSSLQMRSLSPSNFCLRNRHPSGLRSN